MARKKKKIALKKVISRKRARKPKKVKRDGRSKKRTPHKPKVTLRRSRKNLPRPKITTRRKRSTKTTARTTYRAKISPVGAKSFYITRTKIKYRRSRTVTKKKRKYHVTGIEKEFENFYQKNRRKGKSFIGRMQITITAHGKKIKQWVSLPRQFLVDSNAAKEYIMRGLDNDLRKLLRQYELETAASNISVSQLQFEVKRGKPVAIPFSSNQNTARARKKWGPQRKPPA